MCPTFTCLTLPVCYASAAPFTVVVAAKLDVWPRSSWIGSLFHFNWNGVPDELWPCSGLAGTAAMQNVGVSLAKILGANGLQIALWTLGNALLKRMKTMSEDGVGSMVLLRPIIRKTPYPQWMGRLFFSRFVGARPLQTVFVPNGCLCFPLKRGSGVELVVNELTYISPWYSEI